MGPLTRMHETVRYRIHHWCGERKGRGKVTRRWGLFVREECAKVRHTQPTLKFSGLPTDDLFMNLITTWDLLVIMIDTIIL